MNNAGLKGWIGWTHGLFILSSLLHSFVFWRSLIQFPLYYLVVLGRSSPTLPVCMLSMPKITWSQIFTNACKDGFYESLITLSSILAHFDISPRAYLTCSKKINPTQIRNPST